MPKNGLVGQINLNNNHGYHTVTQKDKNTKME